MSTSPLSRGLLLPTLVLALGANVANAEDARPAEAAIVEHVVFRLVDGAAPDDFVTAANALTESFLQPRPGFVRRTLSRAEDGLWIDHLEWTDLDAALRAMDDIATSPAAESFMRLIDPASVELRHLRVAHEGPVPD